VITRAAQSLRLRLADAADVVRGRRDELTPPRRLVGYVGDYTFQATGEEFLGYFRDLAALAPTDRVLDIGCGIGRMARVLAGVLQPPGSYDGFDVVASGIDWCRAHYTHTPVPFRFQHADLYNTAYNPTGTQQPAEYRFPYADASFDLAVATSLFTHLLTDTADRYLAEAARVLAPGGRLFSTWFLLAGDQALAPPPPFQLEPAVGPIAIADPAVPEAAVAFDEAWLRDRLAAHGFDLGTIERGRWGGRPGRSLQDLVVAYRRTSTS
jgi:SAM-dependent methyltransferase